MSLHSQPINPVPEQTARVARAAFPKGNVYLSMTDALGTVYEDEAFAPLFPSRGRPAEAPWRLALVTVFQFAENLSDRQAADMVRSRLDWKYALGLELTHPGFDHSVLCEFRTRLIAGGAEQELLDALLEACRGHGLLRAGGKQRTDSTRVLAAVAELNRLACVGETLRHALNVLAVVARDWLKSTVSGDWYDRYGTRFENERLPWERSERDELTQTIGANGRDLLTAIYGEGAPRFLREVPAVEALRLVWLQYYHAPDAADGVVRMRSPSDMPPPSLTVRSPYDRDARFNTKRTTSWTGYQVHLTETCDEDSPHLITQVTTTPATRRDVEVTADIQHSLSERDLLPAEQLVDAGYVSANLLVTSRSEHGIELVCPAPQDSSWQTKEGAGFDLLSFDIDWEARAITCPEGKRSRYWSDSKDVYGHRINQVVFDKNDCLPCPSRASCTRSSKGPRTIALRPRENHRALQEARRRQRTEEFKVSYRRRAGVEGTMSQGVRCHGLRRSRYRGLEKTRLQHVATAAAVNLQRLDDWWAGTSPAKTRQSAFAKLVA